MLICAAQDAVGHKVDWTRHLWCDIGAGPWEVSIVDVLLLGVIFVSDGAAMPLLAARNKTMHVPLAQPINVPSSGHAQYQ